MIPPTARQIASAPPLSHEATRNARFLTPKKKEIRQSGPGRGGERDGKRRGREERSRWTRSSRGRHHFSGAERSPRWLSLQYIACGTGEDIPHQSVNPKTQ